MRFALTYAATASFRGIRASCRFLLLMIRTPVVVLQHALLSDKAGVATILVLLLAAAIAAQMSVRHSNVTIAAVCVGLGALQILLFRAFLWVYKPAQRMRSFVILTASFTLLIALFRLLEAAAARRTKRVSEADPAGNRLEADEDEGKTHEELVVVVLHFVLRLARGTRRLIPQTRAQLFPILILSWFALAGCVILSFGVSFHSLAVTGFQVLDFSGSHECLWCNITGSFSIFTTAPLSSAIPVSPWALLMCGVEAVDALLLLGLFVSLLMRLVPYDAARGLEKIEQSLKELNDKVDEKLDAAIQELDTIVASGAPPPSTQSQPASKEADRRPP